MASTSSLAPSLSPSFSSVQEYPAQPDHFYGIDAVYYPPPSGSGWLDPEEDPLAHRGIPVFKPTMEQFRNFEDYMNKIECWGNKSGIVKVIPPKEWTDSLPSIIPQMANVKLKSPIEQHMLGRAGLFRQQNIEKRKVMSVREWAELCSKEDLRAPGIDDIGLHARANNGTAKRARKGRKKHREPGIVEPEVMPDLHALREEDDGHVATLDSSPIKEGSGEHAVPPSCVENTLDVLPAHSRPGPDSEAQAGFEPNRTTSDVVELTHTSSSTPCQETTGDGSDDEKPSTKGRRATYSKEAREAALLERTLKDKQFLEKFDPKADWLPPKTKPEDYTFEFCKELERRYWRNCGLGKPAWYGADMQGSLFTDETQSWNVAHLESTLSRLLPNSSKGLPGVNTPYLYFGMWRATFAWHVEDMDLFSINYIHFGAPKFWYAIPQGRSGALEQTLKGYFPKEPSHCPQFLRHKSFLASPTLLSQSSCRPNALIQRAGEFVITYPRGYHAGFNLGFNCAESVNFALDSWLELGRRAQACECVDYSVRIDVDQLLRDREAERNEAERPQSKSRKRKLIDSGESANSKRARSTSEGNDSEIVASAPKITPIKITLKLGPKPEELEAFPCCLCVSLSRDGLLLVHDPPSWLQDGGSGPATSSSTLPLMAHKECADVIPETWVDEIEKYELSDGTKYKELVVFGVDAIVKDRWNLKCNACIKSRAKSHGAPVQCTKGKCPKAFHVSCARDGAEHGIVYTTLYDVEKEVVLMNPHALSANSETMLVEGLPHAEGEQLGGPSLMVSEPALPTVLKMIKKTEVQVLCPQHNPSILEAKRAAKQQKVRNELMSLPPMARIKLRVSAGVFEVSLVRVIEETKSVEVLWDRGMKREFKWGSVVFGSTDGVVGQKPTEPAPEPDRVNPHSQTSTPYSLVPRATTLHMKARPVALSHPPVGGYSGQASTPIYPHSYPHQQNAYNPRASTYQYPSNVWNYPHPTYVPQTTPVIPVQYPHPQSHIQYSYPTGRPGTQLTQPDHNQHSSLPGSTAISYPGYQGEVYPKSPHPYDPEHLPPPRPLPQKELQWQQPYTGPKTSRTSSPALQT